jgi:hypothetical protein
MDVGIVEGWLVGWENGCFDGELVGWDEGCFVGFDVGIFVGLPEG